MEEKYKAHIQWLQSHSLTSTEIEKYNPELMKKIHFCIDEMDKCFMSEDLQGFIESMQKVEHSYIHTISTNRVKKIEAD